MNGLALFLVLYTTTEVQKLSHDDWKVRETASTNLANLMPLSDQFLSQVSNDPEAIIRARRIREQWVEGQSQWYLCRARCLKVPGFKLTPWIDSMPHLKEHHSFWLDRARNHPDLLKLPNRVYEDYRLATVLWIEDQLRTGVGEKEILKELSAGAEWERKWLEERANIEQWGDMLREALGSELIGRPKDGGR